MSSVYFVRSIPSLVHLLQMPPDPVIGMYSINMEAGAADFLAHTEPARVKNSHRLPTSVTSVFPIADFVLLQVTCDPVFEYPLEATFLPCTEQHIAFYVYV